MNNMTYGIYKSFGDISEGDRNKLSKYQKIGISLEMAIHIALKILKIKHKHNPFNNNYASSMGYGVDICIPQKSVDIESKNNKGNYGLSPSWSKREILKRFQGSKARIKLVICGFNNFSRYFLSYLKDKGIIVIELGFQVSKSTFKRAIHILIKKLYWIKKIHNIPLDYNMKLDNYFSPIPTISMSNVLEKFKGCFVNCVVNLSCLSLFSYFSEVKCKVKGKCDSVSDRIDNVYDNDVNGNDNNKDWAGFG